MRRFKAYEELYNLRNKILNLRNEILEKEALTLRGWNNKCITLLKNCLSLCNIMETHSFLIPDSSKFSNEFTALFNNILLL